MLEAQNNFIQSAVEGLGLEVQFFWGDVRLEERFLMFPEVKRFTVGSAAGCDFAMAGASFETITADQDGFAVHLSPKMRGELTRDGRTVALARKPQDVQVGPNDHLRVEMGGIVMQAFLQPKPKRVVVPWTETVDFAILNAVLTLAFLGALFI